MKSNPYEGISVEVRAALIPLIAKDDSYHKTHERRIARTLQVITDQKPKGRLLELGTGSVVPLALSKLAPKLEVHVTDFNLDLPMVGTMAMELAGQSMTAPCYRVDLETMPLPVEDETFDTVICCEVLEHMEVDPMFMLAEINRVLRPGGTLILTTPNVASSRGIWKILRGIEPYFYMQYRRKPALYRHNYEYSVFSVMQALKGAGFDGSIWTEDSFEDAELEDIGRLRNLGYELKHIGDNIFSVSKKIGPVVDRHPAVLYAD